MTHFWVYIQTNWNRAAIRYLHISVQSSVIHSWNVETAKCPLTAVWITRPGSSIKQRLFSLEKEGNSDIRYNWDRPLRYHAKWIVQFGRSVTSNSLQPHGLQHARPPCPSPTLGVYPNSCPLSQWCHPTISSSVVSFSSRPQFFPASGSFQMSQLFTSGGQSTGVSASASVLPMNTQDWSPLDGLDGSPWSPRDAQESSPTPKFKSINSSALSFLYSPTLTSIHDHRKNHSLD